MNSLILSRFYHMKAGELHKQYNGYANGRQKCILKCSNDSFLKTEVLKLLRPTSYICNETDFIAQSKCYRQVYEDDVDECESGDKCLPYKTNLINYVHEKTRRTGNISWEEGIQYVIIWAFRTNVEDLTKNTILI
uniref:Uncharacterized protein n=1 Tax=Romanomermis culicivorax TaxID=13658 RepID=A0A915KXN1_ROMCU